ncbi:MAG: efflux RND transporter periplasmic adaptor subunit [Desulforhopalus sp.]
MECNKTQFIVSIKNFSRQQIGINLWSGLSIILLFLIVGCNMSSDKTSGEERIARVSVSVETVEPAALGERFSLTGSMTAERHAQLSPRVDGLVSEVLVDAGDRVEKGQVLIKLDPAVGQYALARSKAELAEAEAAEREARRQLLLAQNLGKNLFVAEARVETRESEVQLAQAATASARASLNEQTELVERHVLTAPFGGVIAEKLTEAGEWVQLGTPVLSLATPDRVRLDLRLPQERYGHIGDGSQIFVFVDAFGDRPFQARIGALVPVADPGARTFLLRLLIDDPEGRLLPGTSARAEISLPPSEGILMISRDALLRRPDGGQSVFVVDNSGDSLLVRRRSVTVLYEKDELIAVSSGLEAGQRVVTRGNEALKDGQAVFIRESSS